MGEDPTPEEWRELLELARQQRALIDRQIRWLERRLASSPDNPSSAGGAGGAGEAPPAAADGFHPMPPAESAVAASSPQASAGDGETASPETGVPGSADTPDAVAEAPAVAPPPQYDAAAQAETVKKQATWGCLAIFVAVLLGLVAVYVFYPEWDDEKAGESLQKLRAGQEPVEP